MSQVTWPDGLERGPDGPCRQIPQKHTWSSQVWVTRDGDARRRHYNPVSKEWTWAADTLPMSIGADQTHMGYTIDHWISVDRAVALAWLHRAPGSPCTIVDDQLELVGSARTKTIPLAWAEGEYMGNEQGPMEGEKWKALRWRCGLCPCPAGYEISSYGRLMNPKGRCTRGLVFGSEGDRYAAVRGCGLVNFTVAAGLRRRDVGFSPSLYLAVEALATGRTPLEMASTHDSDRSEATAWSYFCRVAPFFSGDELRKRVPRLVAVDLWSLLQGMMVSQERVLGESLSQLMPVVQKRLKRRGEFRTSENQWEQLRLARLSVLAP